MRTPLKTRIGECGFTLLELMISISIVAVMAVIIFSAFRISIRAWEKGTNHVEENQKIRFVYDMVRRQLSSIVTENITNNGKKPYYLRGDALSLSFVTRIPLTEAGSDRFTMIKYKFEPEKPKDDQGDEGKNLLYFEKDAVLKIPDVDTGEPSEAPPYVLLSGVKSIFFEYLKLDDRDQLRWRDLWDPTIENAFPLAVRVTIIPVDDMERVTLVSRIN